MNRRAIAKLCVGVVLAIFLLWFLFRNTDWQAVFVSIRDINRGWILLAILLAVANHFLRVQRWSYIVRASQPAAFRSLFSATSIAFTVNFAIPARIGELVRAYTLSRLERISLAKSAALVALDRMSDALILIILILISLFTYPAKQGITFPKETFGTNEPIVIHGTLIQPVAITLTLTFLLAAVLLILLFTKRELMTEATQRIIGGKFPRLAARLEHLFTEFTHGLQIFRSREQFIRAVVASGAIWSTSIATMTSIFFAFGLNFEWYAPIFVLSLVAASIAVPLTPGMIGQYHFTLIVGLVMSIPAIGIPDAKAIALITYLISFLPMVVIGLFCLVREGITLTELKKQIVNQPID